MQRSVFCSGRFILAHTQIYWKGGVGVHVYVREDMVQEMPLMLGAEAGEVCYSLSSYRVCSSPWLACEKAVSPA